MRDGIGRPASPPGALRRPMSGLQLIDNLCVASASLRESRWKHVRRFGAVDVASFVGETLRRAGACARRQTGAVASKDREELANIVWTLERALASGDEGVRTVVAASLENDGDLGHALDKLASLLDPGIRARAPGIMESMAGKPREKSNE